MNNTKRYSKEHTTNIFEYYRSNLCNNYLFKFNTNLLKPLNEDNTINNYGIYRI